MNLALGLPELCFVVLYLFLSVDGCMFVQQQFASFSVVQRLPIHNVSFLFGPERCAHSIVECDDEILFFLAEQNRGEIRGVTLLTS